MFFKKKNICLHYIYSCVVGSGICSYDSWLYDSNEYD